VTFPALLEKLIQGADLTRHEANEVMRSLMSGAFEDAQTGALLTAMRIKGARPEELAGFAEVMRENASGLAATHPDLVDTCGTGGGPATFNLSTAAAIVAAAAGAKVAKHGNRAVTSNCGSADVLEALGVGLNSDPEQLLKVLENVGIVFLFAPNHHPAMKHVGPARKALGVRTVFNQLGPLANPAGAKRQLVGVYGAQMVRPMAEALLLLGAERAFVVHGDMGMDEVSPCGKTLAAEVVGGEVRDIVLTPRSFGLDPLPFESLAAGKDAKENAKILKEAVTKPDSPRSQAVLPNAAVALLLAGVATDLKDGAERAREAVKLGQAANVLKELVTWTS
jgi:anthranilate phosphoribosyltransferase